MKIRTWLYRAATVSALAAAGLALTAGAANAQTVNCAGIADEIVDHAITLGEWAAEGDWAHFNNVMKIMNDQLGEYRRGGCA